MSESASNYFDDLFLRLSNKDLNDCPYQLVIEAYTHKQITNKHDLFWNSHVISEVPNSLYKTEEFILALTTYFSQEAATNFQIIANVLVEAPETIVIAIRRSELVLNENHTKWDEIHKLAVQCPDILDDLIATSKVFQAAYRERLDSVRKNSEPFKLLSLFEFLSFSAAYSFSHLVEPAIDYDGGAISTSSQVRALTNLVQWKLVHATARDFILNESVIIQSLTKYHIPLILPSDQNRVTANTLLMQFEELMRAQVELDEFISRSVHPFCFDDSLYFSIKNEKLQMEHVNGSSADNWVRNGNRKIMLRGYWFNMALDTFILSGLGDKQIGSLENHERNQIAYVKALACELELVSVYGLSEFVTLDNGFKVDLFQALLSQELMVAFYIKDYVEAFYEEYTEVQNWEQAAGLVAMKGAAKGQNRFPITWSLWNEKVRSILGWTVSNDFPRGNINAAEAILAFWQLDMKKFSKQLIDGLPIYHQQISEHPIIKIGNHCILLPWLMSTQITSLSSVNNLRRFGNQRKSLKDETTRIENQLGDAFEKKGFTVVRNFTAGNPLGSGAGEIDLICVLDNIVIVIEVKSTFYRTTKKEVFYHRDKTLRKAGIQVRKKVDAVKNELKINTTFKHKLQVTTDSPQIVGWIADTSTEFDHELFSGFTKVSIEELLIALADNAHYLCNQEQTLSSSFESGEQGGFHSVESSLYDNGFSGDEFLRVIEQSLVWRNE